MSVLIGNSSKKASNMINITKVTTNVKSNHLESPLDTVYNSFFTFSVSFESNSVLDYPYLSYPL